MLRMETTLQDCAAVYDCLSGSPYRLPPEAVSQFWEHGVLGPMPCRSPVLQGLLGRLRAARPSSDSSCRRNDHDPQLKIAHLDDLARHPSIVHPVAQLLGTGELSFFQARFRVKAPGREDRQPWHQDVGENHGGLHNDGTPVSSLTVWLSLDGATSRSGGVELLPGTHRSLLGNWHRGFHGLVDLQDSLDISEARALDTPANHFHVFHSWAVHCSLSNRTDRPRSALILRYMNFHHASDVRFPHRPCSIG